LPIPRNELVDRLTLAAPNDDAEYDESKNPRHDPDQRCCVHVSLLLSNSRPPLAWQRPEKSNHFTSPN
jgi:hypothetical protein